jgi:phosphoribosylformimino-5-aminoimidazole carboxamide ribotide isomerase
VKVFPAIDLLDGKAVRLLEGRRDQVTVFHDEPWQLVAAFAEAGAERIHVVDLEGAFSGRVAHGAQIREILAHSPVPVQVGGGIRDLAAVEAVFAAGARLAVLGTAAIKAPAFVEDACRRHPGRIVVAVDARDGVVAIEGWVESSGVTAIELARRAAGWGAAAVLYTDVARDGTHGGPNVAATAALTREVGASCEVIASGGVSSLDDLRALAAAGIGAAVVGRALYDRRFSVAEAIAAAREAAPPGPVRC